MNYDPLQQPLILPPTEIDLTQTLEWQSGVSDPLAKAQTAKNPMHEFRDILIECLEGLKTATAGTFQQQKEMFEEKLTELADNANAAFNDLDRRLTAEVENRSNLEQVVDSMLKLELLGKNMPEEIRNQHQGVLANFLRNNAALTAISTEQTH